MTTKITEQNVSNLANLGIQWQAVHVADGSTALAVTAGKGYFVDTTSATQTVNLPANASSTAGDTIVLKDYARKFGTNKVTLGSNTFDGVTNTPEFDTDGQSITLIHMGTTKGWSLVNEDTTNTLGNTFITATGGTVTETGNYKVHTFTGDSNFVVASLGNHATEGNKADYIVVAGGGGGGSGCQVQNDMEGGGGGAGGLRFSALTYSNPVSGDGSALTISTTTYPITVGAGGAGSTSPPDNDSVTGVRGSNSIFSTITSTGGGGGGSRNTPGGAPIGGQPGGSGGGAGQADSVPDSNLFGAGNTPPVSPSQGFPGGRSGFPVGTPGSSGGGGGGGAGVVGQNSPNGNNGGAGGAGIVVAITGSCTTYAGGGGGAGNPAGGGGGAGGGGQGGLPSTTAGTANTGGGGGGGGSSPNFPTNIDGGTGGKGVVIIRYRYK